MPRRRRPPVRPFPVPPLEGEDRLQWLVEVANTSPTDVLTLSPQKLQTAVFQLRRYIFDSEPTSYPELNDAGEAVGHLNDALAVVRRLLAAVADRDLVTFDFSEGRAALDARMEEYLPVVFLDVTLRDRLLHLALEDVRNHFSIVRIRRCPESACRHRLYFPGRFDQKYCSRACSNRGNARAYYKREQEKESGRNRKRGLS